MLDKIEQVAQRFEAIDHQMADPAITADYEKLTTLAQERSDIEPLVRTYRKHQMLSQELLDAREMVSLEDDAEMVEMAQAEVKELETKLTLAQVIDVTTMSGDTVKFGARVTIVNEDTDEESTYQIVGEDEASVRDGKISITSPIARAMISKEVGDVFEVVAPGGAKGYEIIEVKYG